MRSRVGWGVRSMVRALPLFPAAFLPAQSATTAFEWPAAHGGDGPLGRSRAARLHGEQRWDVVVLSDGALTAWVDAASFQSFRHLPFGLAVMDFDVLPFEQRALGGQRDELVIAAASGLWVGRIGAGRITTTLIDGSPAWQAARRIVRFDADGDGLGDFVALKHDGRTFQAWLQTSSGAYVPSRKYDFVAPAEVLDFVVGEFDGDPAASELVVDDALAFRIVDVHGVQVAAWPTLRPDHDRIALLPASVGLATDRLLFTTAATALPGDPARLVGVLDLATVDPCFLTPGAIEALACAEFDGDGLADAALISGPEELLALLHQTTIAGLPFDPLDPSTQLLGLLTPGTGSASPIAPLLFDLGHDGAIDLVEPIATDQTVRLLDGPLFAGSLPAASPDWHHDVACTEPLGGGSSGGVGQFALFLRATFEGAAQLALDPTWRLETRVWRRFAVSPWMNATAVSACSGPLADYLVSQTPGGSGGGDAVEVGIAVEDKNDGWFVELRAVRVVNGVVTEVLPALLGAFTGNGALEGEIDSELAFPGWHFEPVRACSIGGNRIGGFIRIRRMPKTPPGSGVPPPPSSCAEVTH